MPTNDKLAAAAHYVIARLPSDQLGAVKLNKILWFADCEFYRRHGRSLTGETEYVRKDNGPCPVRMEMTISSLKERGAIVESPRPVAHYVRREFMALTPPNIEAFTKEEIDLLMQVALEIAPMTAADASEMSHDALWRETLPLGRMSVAAGSVTIDPAPPEALDWGRRVFAAE